MGLRKGSLWGKVKDDDSDGSLGRIPFRPRITPEGCEGGGPVCELGQLLEATDLCWNPGKWQEWSYLASSMFHWVEPPSHAQLWLSQCWSEGKGL